MKKHVLIYGLLGGVLIVVLKLSEYRFLVLEHSLEIYGGLVALLFASLGIWLGLRITRRPQQVIVVRQTALNGEPFQVNEERIRELRITNS